MYHLVVQPQAPPEGRVGRTPLQLCICPRRGISREVLQLGAVLALPKS